MTTQLRHVVQAVFNRAWYATPEHLGTIADVVRFHVAGGRLSHDEIAERLEAEGPRRSTAELVAEIQAIGAAVAIYEPGGARVATEAARAGARAGARTEGAVGVIPIFGTIMPRANLMTEFSGGATVSGIRGAFREALRDEAVGSILFDFDSPGGYTDGIEELATEIRESRGVKPIVAIADYGMASAAYYLGSQADEIVASPSSLVGWIGTVMVLTEYSKQDEAEGITRTILRNPPGKYGGNPYEPLSDQARGELQAIVDDGTGQFLAAVSKGRGVPVSTVKADYGQGGGMTASRAKAAGLADRVESLDGTIRRLASGKGPLAGARNSEGTPVVRLATDGSDTAPVLEPSTQPDPDPAPDAPDQTTEAAAALALARARATRR